MRFCAPDVPFLDLLLWYGKQIGAVMTLVSIGFVIFMALLFLYNLINKKWK